jgi:hypothetical protein
MKNRTRLLTVISLLVCVGAVAPPISGQQGYSDKEIRDWEARRDALNRVSEAPHSRPTPRGRGVALPERSQDFKRIRLLNDELKQAVSLGGAIDLEFVAKSASEIRKSAKRLRYRLALPASEEDPKRRDRDAGAAPEQLRSSLDLLGELIAEFVNNPVFRDARTVDAKLLIKAGRDLDEIIELSSWVKQNSEKLAAQVNGDKQGSRK